jgi:hypothetical protein
MKMMLTMTMMQTMTTAVMVMIMMLMTLTIPTIHVTMMMTLMILMIHIMMMMTLKASHVGPRLHGQVVAVSSNITAHYFHSVVIFVIKPFCVLQSKS